MNEDELASLDPEHTPTGDEFALLTGFLDLYRAVMTRKAQASPVSSWRGASAHRS